MTRKEYIAALKNLRAEEKRLKQEYIRTNAPFPPGTKVKIIRPSYVNKQTGEHIPERHITAYVKDYTVDFLTHKITPNLLQEYNGRPSGFKERTYTYNKIVIYE
ncbi:MAG: hypothetical protein IJ504_00925 [Bacteroidales bacterium]|nr:hypothetical protein [Bacteroidales bacterium]